MIAVAKSHSGSLWAVWRYDASSMTPVWAASSISSFRHLNTHKSTAPQIGNPLNSWTAHVIKTQIITSDLNLIKIWFRVGFKLFNPAVVLRCCKIWLITVAWSRPQVGHCCIDPFTGRDCGVFWRWTLQTKHARVLPVQHDSL